MKITHRDEECFLHDIIVDNINGGLLEQTFRFIQQKFEPQDVFDRSDLERWAEENGFKKED